MRLIWQMLGAIAFYTTLPLPHHWPLEFAGIARWAPVVGVGLGLGLAGVDLSLTLVGLPLWPRSALVVACWLWFTGGLHLDGAMDLADGLAVPDRDRRLAVMADSRSGAFGVMAAVLIIMLKTTALASLTQGRWLALAGVAGWGRWGQLVAIATYPYLKSTGKGAFHKTTIRSGWAALPSGVLLLGLSGGASWADPALVGLGVRLVVGGGAIAVLTGVWIQRQLGGHTGDTYGAVVEWTEALLLCVCCLPG